MVVCHGLLGSRSNFRSTARLAAKQLQPARNVVTVDARGHGETANPSGRMSYAEMAADLAMFIEQHSPDRPVALVGHSMGGKMAMTLALSRPALVERLVVVDIAPKAYPTQGDAVMSVAQRAADSLQRLDLAALGTRDAVDKALASHIPEAGLRAFLLQNLVSDKDSGRLRWRVDLAAIRASLPALADFAVPPGAVFDKPVLFIRGQASGYIDPEGDRPAILSLFPQATIRSIPGGHWVHQENRDGFLSLLLPFLNHTDTSSKK